jgi:positive phototaxis protein PixI
MQIPSLLTFEQEHQQLSGEPYLKLRLAPQVQAVLSMSQAVEALVVPAERLNPMPNMPPWVMGLLNQRTRIFWVLDLPQLFGLLPVEPIAQRYCIVILRDQQRTLAIAVPEVSGIIRFDPALIESPIGTVDAALVPYLRGHLPTLAIDPASVENAPIWVIEPSAILQSVASQLT